MQRFQLAGLSIVLLYLSLLTPGLPSQDGTAYRPGRIAKRDLVVTGLTTDYPLGRPTAVNVLPFTLRHGGEFVAAGGEPESYAIDVGAATVLQKLDGRGLVPAVYNDLTKGAAVNIVFRFDAEGKRVAESLAIFQGHPKVKMP